MSETTERERISRLLIVEDDEGQLRTLIDIMEDEGFDVVGCSTAAEALEHVGREDFGVAVIDLRLPDLSGTKLLEKIQGLNGQVRVIIHTAYGSFDSAKEAVKYGAFGYVEKAGGPGALVRDVHRAFRAHLDRYADDLEAAVADRTRKLQEANEALSTEITERKRAEEELEERRVFQEAVLECIADGIVACDREGTLAYFNRATREFHGLPAEPIPPEEWASHYDLYEADGKTPLTHVRIPLFRTLKGENVSNQEMVIAPKGLPARTLIAAGRMLVDSKGNPLGAVVSMKDVTERKRAEAALRESEEQFRLVTEGSSVGIVMHQDRKVVYVNPQAAARAGYPREALVGRDPVEFFHPDDRDAIAMIIKAREQGQDSPAHREWRLIGHDGRVLWFDVLATRMIYRGRPAVLATLVDITERKQAEEERRRLEDQLRQSQKMEAIGQLAGGVSHDINNILTAIFGNIELMQGRMEQMLPPGDPLLGDLSAIERSAEHAAMLTRQLLAFSRRQVIKPEVLDPNRILTGMEKMLRRLVREDIDFAMVCAADVWPIRADVGQIQQVIMNLVVNAAAAMPDGGKLTVETANVTLDEGYVAEHAETQPGPHVMLAVSDTGCGMDGQTLERIFEPFFTTKPVGEGTGLGLATVHGIVKQAGGHIAVDSEPGVGTTFRVYLAAVEEAVAVAADPQPVEEMPGGKETILVCEDDDLVRQLACQALKGRGYTVLAAEDAKRGLELAAKHPGPIHLLVTDVVMPDMNGRQLAVALGRTRSEIKVLYISGYTSEIISNHGVLEDGMEFLGKPFRLPSLLRRVREVLDTTKSASNVS